MVKIVKKRSLGVQAVYDIGVAKDHNFILVNGLVASNCFNKSHSTAYAYITYQTAYLKANYPVEYMTALLSASSDNQDKVEKYRENCLKMGIEVKPPDINSSHKDFAPQGRSIIFGLSAVKNLGEGAIENILQARGEAGGKFTSFVDFLSRVNLKTLNRRALETLINCGAFDSIHSNRRQLLEGLDLSIKWIQKRHQEQESGQFNLFDLGVEPSQGSRLNFDSAPVLPDVADFSLQDKLKLEKEHLGFYVSEHPLQRIQESAKVLSPININQLEEQKNRQLVCLVGMLASIKRHIDKNGNTMAFLDIEDISSQVDGVIFASKYEAIKNNLQEETPLIIWGKVDKREDKIQLLIEDIEPVEKVNLVAITLTPDAASKPQIQGQLKSILQEQSGDKSKAKIPVIGIIEGTKERIFVRFGHNYWVQDGENTVQALCHAGFNAYSQLLTPSGV